MSDQVFRSQFYTEAFISSISKITPSLNVPAFPVQEIQGGAKSPPCTTGDKKACVEEG